MPTKLSEVSLDSLAEEFDYSKLAVHPNNDGRMCSYVRGHEKVHVYLKTGTVATCIDHPRHGKTQLFRRNLKWEEICDVFQNLFVKTALRIKFRIWSNYWYIHGMGIEFSI